MNSYIIIILIFLLCFYYYYYYIPYNNNLLIDVNNNYNNNYNNYNNYNEYFNNNNNKSLIFHYVEWCGFCKSFKPIWNDIKNYCMKNNINCYEVNHTDDKNPPIINPIPNITIPLTGINSFPTIVFYDGSSFTNYQGPRNYSNIIELIK